MLNFTNRTSPVKSRPCLLSATASGISFGAQQVRHGSDVFNIPAMVVPVAYDSEDAVYRVSLCTGQSGAAIVLIEGDETPASYTEVCYLARFRLASASDTPETVSVEVPRVTCTGQTPPDAVVHQVAPAPVLPDALNPERVAGRKKRARIRDLRQQLRTLKEAGTTVTAMTAAQRALVTELTALLTDGVPVFVP